MFRSTGWDWLYYGWTASEILIALAIRTPKSKGRVHDGASQLLLWVVIALANFACGWGSYAIHPNLPGSGTWLPSWSTGLMVLALTVRWSAVFSLGKAFSANVAIKQNQKLRTDGLYSAVRHPSYSGLLLIFLAIGLHAGNWVSLLVVTLPTTAALLYRIHLEERVLQQAFGPQYAAYSLRTKRLVPGVY